MNKDKTLDYRAHFLYISFRMHTLLLDTKLVMTKNMFFYVHVILMLVLSYFK